MSKSGKLVIGITSSALFDMHDSNEVYLKHGVKAYAQYQISRESEVLQPGEAFGLVKKLLELNKCHADSVEVILLSRNSADTGLRVFQSIEHYGLQISRAAFCSGQSPYHYAKPYGCHLLLSTNAEDVERALANQMAAAMVMPSAAKNGASAGQVRIAFDGDAVVFSDESEKIYKQQGLDAFVAHEKSQACRPMKDGPFKDFLLALHRLQKHYTPENCPIRTALVTARSAPAHERVIRTLRSWDIRIDEAVFLGGMNKGEFLRVFAADIFFDDQHCHCESARAYVATGHVPHGVANSCGTNNTGAKGRLKVGNKTANTMVKELSKQYH